MIEDGIILVNKPAGISSFGVVARVRRELRDYFNKKVKVGHTGTLDPFATGLIILVTGTECKNAAHYSKLDKTYEATITLGKTSSTGDPEGEITEVSEKIPTKKEVEATLSKFRGEITQTPPIFSAIKVNGQRAYKLARKGQIVSIPSRKVTINELEVVDYEYPYVKVRANVSSGTYIRTVAEDIGASLGTGAYCSELKRTRVGEFLLKDAREL